MRMKKATAFGLAALMAATMIPAVPAMAKGDDSEGSVYYLNFKPEQADQWSDLAKKYTDETGVPVTVVTAASGTYESTLKSEMAKDEVPTLFQVNGPVGLASWKDYCYDLKDSDVYKNVESDDFVLKDDSGAVDGIAYVIETYGIIYNKALLKKYCEMDGAVIKSADEINNFETLKKVADDIQAKKDDLGVDGAFTSAGFDSSSDWRFKTHLANLPIYYEYKEDGITSTDAIKGTYLDNFKNLFDLYITDSTCEPSLLSSKTIDDANAEFGLGEAVFYQNGTWAYDNIKDNEVADEDMGMLPIYIGVDGEEDQGLCTGSENYWCVNKKADEKDIQAYRGRSPAHRFADPRTARLREHVPEGQRHRREPRTAGLFVPFRRRGRRSGHQLRHARKRADPQLRVVVRHRPQPSAGRRPRGAFRIRPVDRRRVRRTHHARAVQQDDRHGAQAADRRRLDDRVDPPRALRLLPQHRKHHGRNRPHGQVHGRRHGLRVDRPVRREREPAPFGARRPADDQVGRCLRHVDGVALQPPRPARRRLRRRPDVAAPCGCCWLLPRRCCWDCTTWRRSRLCATMPCCRCCCSIPSFRRCCSCRRSSRRPAAGDGSTRRPCAVLRAICTLTCSSC